MRTEPGAHFCARIQCLQHQKRARILAWVLKKKSVYASQQKRKGKTDLSQFIANRGSKAVEEALSISA